MATFYNQATLSYQDTTVSSNIVTGQIVQPLTVTKTAVNETYQPGTILTYVVSIRNTGGTPFTGLTLTDDLGAYRLQNGNTVVPLDYVEGSVLYFLDGVPQDDPDVTDVSPLTITGITVPAEGNAIVLYQAVANEYAPLGRRGKIKNCVEVSGTRVPCDLTACAVVRAEDDPVLSISKALSPASVEENGRLTYTLVMENRGRMEACGDVVLTDEFDPILSDLEVTYNGAPWTEGEHYTYNENTGLFTSLAGQITIPAATAEQDPQTGVWSMIPGAATVVVTGTI